MKLLALGLAALLAGGCSCSCSKKPHEDKPATVAVASVKSQTAAVARPRKAEASQEIAYARRETVTIEADDADLRDVIDQISRQAGVNIAVEPQIRERVTINLRDIHWLEAVQVVAQLTRCEVNVLRGGVYYVVDPPKVTLRTW